MAATDREHCEEDGVVAEAELNRNIRNQRTHRQIHFKL